MAEFDNLPRYAELHCLSNFSFQRGASHPEELVERAHALGYQALAITDACSMAGVVRAHVKARETGLHLIIGTEWRIHAPTLAVGGFTLVLLAQNRAGYARLCEAITRIKQQPAFAAPEQPDAPPCHLRWEDWPFAPSATHNTPGEDGQFSTLDPAADAAPTTTLDDTVALLLPWRPAPNTLTPAHPDIPQPTVSRTSADLLRLCAWLQQMFGQRAWLALEWAGRLDDAWWLRQLREAATASGIPLVATGNVHLHHRRRQPLHDVLTAVRLRRPIHQCGTALHANAETHLRSRARLAQEYPADCLAETLRIAATCTFNLDQLRYEYPQEVVPHDETPASYLRRRTFEGAHLRYPKGLPDTLRRQIEHELALIAELDYEKYFLTVFDVVRFAREADILCQGRGSAANSAVCYCLGITEVDPVQGNTLFERFISRERHEPPDIDVDFEHQRREEVIQYLYRRFGRHRAALTAAVHTYHARGAMRDIGKALGLDAALVDNLAKSHTWWDGQGIVPDRLQALGLDPSTPVVQHLQTLVRELIGFPRHLSQHSGGFVLTGDRLTSTVPVIPAAMEGRTTIEWDKDDIDALGLLKVDVLALGMLTALRRCLDLVGQRRGQRWRLQDVPREDPATYDMICRADTVGVFQIESRAQMSMLPRLQPRCYYDLVVEVAIVRPGPIQGGMIHPYLKARERARAGLPLELPQEALRPALARTLGVPIFQEQVMQIAMIAADFTPGEADALRRSMAAWRRKGGVDRFRERLIEGMVKKNYEREFAEAIFRQIEGFGEYGFPESHAASFALLVYASAWLKCHEPACFLVSLLNSQPMGFYGPAQLVQDARRHGVEVLPVDVLHSHWNSTLEGDAVRLGLSLVAHLGQAAAQRIVQCRELQQPSSVETLARDAQLDTRDLQALASADALQGLAGHRRQQVWSASAWRKAPPLLRNAPIEESTCPMPEAPEGEAVTWDYAATGLTLRSHPLALLRPRLIQRRLLTAAELAQQPNGRLVRACGLVTTRQRPGTAKGVVFVTLEDETGTVQVIVWPALRDRQRETLLGARLLAVHGQWQRTGEVCHLIAGHLADLTPWLGDLPTSSRDFR